MISNIIVGFHDVSISLHKRLLITTASVSSLGGDPNIGGGIICG